jgi:hypothetical protein
MAFIDLPPLIFLLGSERFLEGMRIFKYTNVLSIAAEVTDDNPHLAQFVF